MLAFETPRVPELVNCKGVAFDKNGPNAVSPIAIAEAWLRLGAIVYSKSSFIAPSFIRFAVLYGRFL